MISKLQAAVWKGLCPEAVEYMAHRLASNEHVWNLLKTKSNWRGRKNVHKWRAVEPSQCDTMPRHIQFQVFPVNDNAKAQALAIDVAHTLARWRKGDGMQRIPPAERDAQLKQQYIKDRRAEIAKVIEKAKSQGHDITERQAWNRLNGGGDGIVVADDGAKHRWASRGSHGYAVTPQSAAEKASAVMAAGLEGHERQRIKDGQAELMRLAKQAADLQAEEAGDAKRDSSGWTEAHKPASGPITDVAAAESEAVMGRARATAGAADSAMVVSDAIQAVELPASVTEEWQKPGTSTQTRTEFDPMTGATVEHNY